MRHLNWLLAVRLVWLEMELLVRVLALRDHSFAKSSEKSTSKTIILLSSCSD